MQTIFLAASIGKIRLKHFLFANVCLQSFNHPQLVAHLSMLGLSLRHTLGELDPIAIDAGCLGAERYKTLPNLVGLTNILR